MPPESSVARGASDDPPPDDEFTEFLSLLNELKATGCNLLVVGDAPRELFTRASEQLLGSATELRYRILAVTDATPQSVADRLPDADATPRPLTETTQVLNHAGAPRSVTAATDPTTPSELADIRERRIADPELRGLESGLVEAIEEVAEKTEHLRPAQLRVGLDSLGPLLDHYGEDPVQRCLDVVGGYVRNHDAMAHYVLTESYDSERVQSFVPRVDAVIEIRAVDPDEYGHDAQQRWHVPQREITTPWTPL